MKNFLLTIQFSNLSLELDALLKSFIPNLKIIECLDYIDIDISKIRKYYRLYKYRDK